MNAAEQEDAEEDREKVRRGSANNSDEFAQEGRRRIYSGKMERVRGRDRKS